MFCETIRKKNVLFITTHRRSYIRCTQELEIIKQEADRYTTLYSDTGNHLLSALKIWIWLLLHSTKKYDVVVVSYMCQLIVPFMYWKFSGLLVVDFFISLFDSLVYDRGLIRENSFFSRIVYKLDKKSVDKADLVIADTKSHASFFKEEFGIHDRKLETIYLCADKSIYYPMEIVKPLEWKDKFLVIYFGTVIPLQGVEIVLKSIEIMRSQTDIHFIFIGPISAKLKKGNLGNATFIKWVEQTELAKYIAMSDLGLAGHFNCRIRKANRTIPTKAYIYDAMNKPMVLGDSEANHELFKEDSHHFFVKMGDPEELAQKIMQIKNNNNK